MEQQRMMERPRKFSCRHVQQSLASVDMNSLSIGRVAAQAIRNHERHIERRSKSYVASSKDEGFFVIFDATPSWVGVYGSE
jgi:hypothetical protein